MSRARNIKPGFFKNDLLVELAFEYRLLFVGLWTMADREGRLEDRPTKIRMEVFPADTVDVNAGLQALHDAGFIARYEAAGTRYVQVLTWGKHQNPHVKEAKSTIPAPGEHGASTVPAPKLPERAGLIPDSLIPDSLEEHTEANASAAAAAVDDSPADPIWGTGLAFLIRKGIPVKPARSLIGQLRKTAGDVETGSILSQAEAQDITDPAPWLMASAAKAKARAGPNGSAPASRTLTAIQTLQGMKNGNVDSRRDSGRPEQAALPEPRAHASG